MPALTKRQRKGQDPINRTGQLLPKTSGSPPESPPTIKPPPPQAPTTSAPVPTASQGSWAQVAGKKKKKTTTSAKPAPAAPTPTTSTKAPPLKKGLSLRDRKLIIKRDGSKLPSTTVTGAFRARWDTPTRPCEIFKPKMILDKKNKRNRET